MYRIGLVTAVDAESRKARVNFPDVGIVSDWLPVLGNSSLITLDIKSNGQDWDITAEYASAARGLGVGEEYTKSHPDVIEGVSPGGVHEVTVKVHGWLPFIGQSVLCLYNDEFNGAGFILGGLS